MQHDIEPTKKELFYWITATVNYIIYIKKTANNLFNVV